MAVVRTAAAAAVLSALLLHTTVLLLSTGWWLLHNSGRYAASGASCQLDNEGSWSIGVFKGRSPFELVPIEAAAPRQDTAVAWPVANPVLTCASITDAPSNFVADPFLLHRDGKLYMFFETKSNEVGRGEIGAAVSADGGRSWQHVAVVLREQWHLSYPFVFEHGGQVYMVPEGSGSGKLWAYRAIEFPLKWERLPQPLVDKPLIDASLVEWQGLWYMFASDHGRPGVRKNGELEIWYAIDPLGPWKQHARNPVIPADRSGPARSGGRPLVHGGRLYRWGQDCAATYGHSLGAYEVTKLSPTEFEQRRVPHNISGLPAQPPKKTAWNSARHHHLDMLQLPGSGEWVAAMDGDRVPSGPISSRLLRVAWLLAAPWAALAAVVSAGRVYQHHRRALRGWLLRASARAAGIWPLSLLAGPLLRLAERQGSMHKRKVSTAMLSPDGKGDYLSTAGSSDLEEGDSPPAPQTFTPDPLRRSTSLGGLVVSPTAGGLHGHLGGVLSPRHSGNMALQQQAAASSFGHGHGLLHATPSPLLLRPRSGAHGLMAAQSSSWRRRWRRCSVLGLPLRAVVLGCLALAALCTALCVYSYAEPFLAAPRAYSVDGQMSQFTLLVMTYEARLSTLRHFLRHYSRCTSVSDIVVVWNKGTPPVPERDFDSAVPVRVRVERVNSLNNRFREDPLIRNRAVLSLDDDIMMPCQDLERGFASWRMHPEKMVGYYPRLIEGSPQLVFRGERYAVERGGYNAILTGAAFIDTWTAFPAYWAEAVAPARAEVDKVFNGEDLLMNFVLANRTRAIQALHKSLWHNTTREAESQREALEAAFWGNAAQGMHAGDLLAELELKKRAKAGKVQGPKARPEGAPWGAVEFIRPTRRLDISKLSGVGISHNWGSFKAAARSYLDNFVETFGDAPLQTQNFDWGLYTPPFCSVGFLGCCYL